MKYFLRTEVARSYQGIFISQQKYITNLLKEKRNMACNPAYTPIDPNHKLWEAKEDLKVNIDMYHKLVGKLIDLAHMRLYIAYVVSVLSQFIDEPKEVHL